MSKKKQIDGNKIAFRLGLSLLVIACISWAVWVGMTIIAPFPTTNSTIKEVSIPQMDNVNYNITNGTCYEKDGNTYCSRFSGAKP